MKHSLDLVDRGAAHCHRWLPECVCGWRGVQRRRKREAVLQYRSHLAAYQRIDLDRGTRRRRGRTATPKPAALTPPDLLPERLR